MYALRNSRGHWDVYDGCSGLACGNCSLGWALALMGGLR